MTILMEETTEKREKAAKRIGIIAVVISALISFLISVAADLDRMELGALFNVFLPLFIGFFTIVGYILVCYITYTINLRIISCIILVLYNIYTGVSLNQAYLPFPF